MDTKNEQLKLKEKFKIDINDYKIINHIKNGGFGSVYLVQDKKTEEQFAAKVIRQVDKKMINREIGIMMRIQHPTIIKLIGYSFYDPSGLENVTLIMQLAKKGSLSKIIKDAEKGLGDAEYDNTARQIILVGIARGMMLLHQKNIIHRDLKPDNVLIDENFYPHITDFGLSKVIDSLNSMNQSNSYGTSYYMAPEVISGTRYNGKADVYSFGILMFEVLTETDPYPATLPAFQIIHKVVYENLRPSFNVPIKKSLQNLIERCWSSDPSERPTFEEIYNKLAFNVEDSIYDIYDGSEPNKLHEEENKYYLEDVDIDALNYYIDDINGDNSTKSSKYDELIQKFETLQNQISPLIKENNEMRGKITDLVNANEKMQPQIDDLKNENEKMKRQIDDLKNENKKKQPQIDDLKNENEKMKRQIDDLKNEKQNKQPQIDDLKNQNEEMQRQITYITTHNQFLENQMSQLKKDYSRLIRDIKRSNQVDRISLKSASFESPYVKLLLLGTKEAGKSTIWRQFKYICNGNNYESEKEMLQVIKINIIDDAKKIVNLIQSPPPENLVKCIDIINKAELTEESYTTELAISIFELWKSQPVIKELITKNHSRISLCDNFSYFFENALKFAGKYYSPTFEDIIKSRIVISGISALQFKIDNSINISLVDVGGQVLRSEWQRAYFNVSYLLFVVPLSDFDQYKLDDESTRRTSDSHDLFSNTANSPAFNQKPIFIIFTKVDVFEQKLAEFPESFREVYPDFKGDITDVDECIEHVKNSYLKLAIRDNDAYYWIETIKTCSIDDDSVDELIQTIAKRIKKNENSINGNEDENSIKGNQNNNSIKGNEDENSIKSKEKKGSHKKTSFFSKKEKK